MTQQINLYDPALLPQHDWCNGRFIVGLGALLALVLGGQWGHERWELARALAASAAHASATTAVATASIDAEIAELQTQLTGGEALLRTAGGLSELPKDSAARLEALISAMPQNLWLDEVEFNVDRRVRITGGVGDAAGLAAFSKRLGESGTYRGLPLKVVALEPRKTDDAEAGDGLRPIKSNPANASYTFVLSSADAELAGASR